MSTQTEAERLAYLAERHPSDDVELVRCAAELRRLVSFNQQLLDEQARLSKLLAEQPAPAEGTLAQEVIGCFNAALLEGLQEALAETTDEHLKDLVERRLMYALYAAQETAPQAPKENQS